MTGGGEGDPRLVLVDGADRDPGLHRVADLDRRLELQVLAEINAARPRELGAPSLRLPSTCESGLAVLGTS